MKSNTIENIYLSEPAIQHHKQTIFIFVLFCKNISKFCPLFNVIPRNNEFVFVFFQLSIDKHEFHFTTFILNFRLINLQRFQFISLLFF